MGGRRLFAVLAVIGVALSCLVLPAAAQTPPPPPPVITSISPACAPVSRGITVTVSGTSPVDGRGGIEVRNPFGEFVGEAVWSDTSDDVSDGRWSTPVFFPIGSNGYYRILARDGFQQQSNIATFSVPCRNTRVTLSPTCSTPGSLQSLTVSGFEFLPNGTGYVYYDWNGSAATDSRIRIQIDANGSFATTPAYKSTPFSVTAPNRTVRIHVTDGGRDIDVDWSPCPPVPTTTTSTTTTSTAPPDDGPAPTTTSRPTVPGSTSTTLPPTIDIPPPTPGATLTVTPKIGPPGFVTGAVGTGFPPGPVVLTWSPGLGTTTAVAGPDGTFSVRALIFPRDRLGPRALIATGGAVTAFDGFLVVQATVHPSSGREVAQITRIRRFNNR